MLAIAVCDDEVIECCRIVWALPLLQLAGEVEPTEHSANISISV